MDRSTEGNIKRIGGVNRFETAKNIAYELSVIKDYFPSQVFLTYSQNFPDSLSISPYAARRGYPILFASSGALEEHTLEYLNQAAYGANVTAIGGPSLISNAALQQAGNATGGNTRRIYGSNRYETSAKIAYEYKNVLTKVSIATGNNYPDALAGSVFAAYNRSCILLVNNNQLDLTSIYANRYFLKDYIYVFGGTGVISDATVQALFNLPVISGDPLEVLFLEPKPKRITEYGTAVDIAEVTNDYQVNEDGTCSGTIYIYGTRIAGSGAYKLRASLYDADNVKVMDSTNSQELTTGSGGSFVAMIPYTNLPQGVYEIYIYDNIVVD